MAAPSEYLLEPIRDSGEFTLYRGRHRGHSTPVLVVALAAEQPLPQSLRRLEHEYSLAAELEPTWAAKPLALTRHEGRTILVIADPGGEPLDRILDRDWEQPLDVVRFLHLAIGLATSLGHVHQRGLIHKDIKPENVLVDDSGHAWLTGFGIASRLPNERQAPVPPEIVAGTLAYMSPEQTGRMNRSIDARSDLYSLGVTLYEMLTGMLPFAAADPLEWVHCHIARQPVAPVDSGAFPEPLSAIIMKLLAKNAEERYQTAAGLEADLRRCLVEWQSHGRIDSFPLGADDSSDRLLIPEKLYGREREVDTLLAAFDRVVAQGTAELVLVSGYSGVGKSSVVNELHKVLVPPRGLFAAGKFDQYKRDIPYATLAQAFQTLVRQILVKSEAEESQWRHDILEAVGLNGQLIVNLIPEVEFVIGKQPPVADLPPQEARNRFQLVFRRFLGAFATPAHPLALFLDDLQWLDTATLELLERLITDPDVRHVLLIGAYRDNEVSSSHPLMRTLAAIREAGASTQEIVLSPLGLDDVGRLVAEAMRCEREAANPLAQLVHEKTGGNPFFAIQFLMVLAGEGLLRLDRDAAGWIWDLDRIRAKGYSDSVVDLMVGKLQRLPDMTQAALQQLACLGNAADIATLSVVFGQSEEEIHASFLEAVRAGLVLRLEGSYAFLHDRIQEAAYALIPERERAGVHIRIGRVLLVNLTADGLAEHLFDVANQLNRGSSSLIDHDEKVQVAAINLRVGRKLKASAAYASARAHFAAGMALLDESHWSRQYDLTFNECLELAECEFLTGQFDEAEQLIGELLQRASSKVDEAAVYHLKVQLHLKKSDNEQALAAGLTCLRKFDIDMPTHPTQEQVQAEYEAVWSALDGRPIESLIDLPLMTDPELEAAMKVLSALIVPAYFIDQRFYCLQLYRSVTITLQHGISKDSTFAYVSFGLILGWVFHRYDDSARFSKLAYDLVEKHGFIASRAKVRMVVGVLAFWAQPIDFVIDFFRTASVAAIEIGDLTFACIVMYELIACLLVRNDHLDVVRRESEMALDFARRAKYSDAADLIVIEQRFIATMQGQTATFSTFNDTQFDEATFEARYAVDRGSMVIGWYWLLKLKARYLSGDFKEALEAASKAKQFLEGLPGQFVVLDYFYFAALTVAALYGTASADEQQEWGELLKANCGQLREWAENNPPTFADKHALVLAEIARIEKRDADALHLYEEATHSAREHGFVQNEGVAHELAAQYYLSRGLDTAGYAHLRLARNCYDRWGAYGKVKQLDERYPRLREERTSASPATIGPSAGQLDVETIVKASQALSSEMVLPRLIEKLVRIAMEHAGAERGLLILIRAGEPRIEAEATSGPGKVEVIVRQAAVTPSDLPQSALHYVIRTQERVLLDDASADHVYSKDEYVRQKRSKSVLCLPIVKQTKLVGALYLENKLTPGVFTPDRVTILQLLSSQAAISLENAGLYSDLQRSEALLRRSENESRLIVDSIPGLIALLSPTGEIEMVNRQLLEYFGQTLEQLKAWGTNDTVHPEDLPHVIDVFSRSIAAGSPYETVQRFKRSDGVYRWFKNGGFPLRDSNGNVARWCVLLTDIDDQKRAEEALRGSEHESRLIVDSIPGMVAVMDASGAVERVSQPVLDYYGKSLEELKVWTDAGTIHPEDLPGLLHAFTQSLSSGHPIEFEARARRFDGAYRWFQLRGRPLRDRQGRIIRWYFLQTDVDERKRAEEALREREYESRLIVDSIPGHVAVLSASGELEWLSQQILDYHGKSLEELKRWRRTDGTFHPEDLLAFKEGFIHSITSGDPIEFELRLRRFDGVYRWFHFRGRPLRDRQGQVIRWYCLETDIDDRKRAEDALKSRERDLRLIIDTIPAVAWSARPDGTADFLNQPYLDYTGLTAEEGMAWGWTAAIHPDDRNGLVAEWQTRVRSTGDSGEVEARLRRHDGEYRWFLFLSNALRDEEGRIVKWYGTNIDIEDRKRAEDELRRKENFLATAQRLSQSGSFSWCLDTNEVTFSEEAFRIFGFAHDSPVTLQQIDNRIHPEDRHILPLKRKQAKTVGEGQDYQIRLLMPDGSVKYLHSTSSEIRDASGRRMYIGAFQDVTQRRLAQEALDKAQSELAHVTRITALSALTASIAHEINQPLAGIITNASTCLRMLQGNPPNVDGARETARRTIRDGNRASDVITRLRALFSKREFTLERMDLNQATQEVIAMTLNDLQRNGVIVRSELAEDLLPVNGDRVQLQQVILNLIRNASEAMNDVHERPRCLLIRTEREGNGYVRLSVRDEGVGFEGQNIDKIFDSFYTTKSGGMGIGLAVSRSIIDRHQGRLWAEPNDGPGATFALTIPCGSDGISGAAPGVANS